MDKKLVVMHDDGGYYEPTIEIEVVDMNDEKTSKRNFRDYNICKNSQDLSDIFIYVSDYYEQHSKIEITISEIKELKNTSYYTLLENYEYLQKLKDKAYQLTTHKNDYIHKYRKFVYGDTDGYGSFRQELVVFNNTYNITKTHSEFLKFVNGKLMKDFSDLLPRDAIVFERKVLETELQNIDSSIAYVTRDIKTAQDRLSLLSKRKVEVLDEIKKLGG